MTRGSNELHPALEGPLVGICPDKGRQERVVNVDNARRVFVAEPVRQNLHEARENDQFCSCLSQQAPEFVESIRLSLVEGNKLERDLFAFHQRSAGLVVGNHQRHVDAELT
jgi:hypothetical protein